MNLENTTTRRSYGWLDSLAIGMSLLCAVHCLLTPILIVFLPIIATTFWVHQDFHLWMVLFVVPTTSAAVFMGCRKHRDKAVLILSMLGLVCLVSIAGYETWLHADSNATEAPHCPHCVAQSKQAWLTPGTLINVLGGMLLASAHGRNFLLCRKSSCSDGC